MENIGRWYQELSQRYGNTKIYMNQCGMQQDYLMLEYLEGQTLENILDMLLMEGKVEELVRCLLEYLDEVKKGFWLGHFEATPEFEKVFGHVELSHELEAGDVVDIDMVLNNVLVQGSEWNLIDYEWTFAFPIPYHFVVYRILLYYLNGNSARNCLHVLPPVMEPPALMSWPSSVTMRSRFPLAFDMRTASPKVSAITVLPRRLAKMSLYLGSN